MAVKKGDKIKVEYTGTFEDGTVFDSTEKHGAPLEFEAGAGMVIKGFDEAVMGMKKGEEKEFTIEPKNGYGDYNPELIKKVSKDKIPDGKELKEGMMIALQAPNGMQIPGKIAGATEDEISLDLNHPLAGKTLKFRIKITEIGTA
jgi:peptidylprolyl isomerase